MTKLAIVRCDPQKTLKCSKETLKNIEKHKWVYLVPPKDQIKIPITSTLPKGEGIIISSGGSIGGPNLCFQLTENLTNSALATAKWLEKYGINPKECIILNSLPFHHVSGFMPWWRHRIWGTMHYWISSSMMHEPIKLEKFSRELANKYRRPLITSLVPTQLVSLIDDNYGLKWLKSLSMIWVGGASIPTDLANRARREAINLAPCYGTTETTAMVTCLSPRDFLKGFDSVGFPLEDVEINVNKSNLLKIKTNRIALLKWKNNQYESVADSDGWWEAGDLAQYLILKNKKALQIIGRRDLAVNSGGETIYPEDIEMKLMTLIRNNQVPIKDIFILGIEDQKWGQRIVALIRFKEEKINKSQIVSLLTQLIQTWQPSTKPFHWYDCPKLSRNLNGKWELKKWQDWIDINLPIS
tara:strand:- start:940 stop:2175 length:1236 start_codon:yes stop_codon:yes gene_type:complete